MASLSLSDGLAIGLVIVGLGLVVAAWRDRAWSWSCSASCSGRPSCSSKRSTFRSRPVRGSARGGGHRGELADDHELFAGALTLDLRRAPLSDGPQTVDAAVGMGKLQVIIPADSSVEVDAKVKAGNIDGDLAPTPDEEVWTCTRRSASACAPTSPTCGSTCRWGSVSWWWTVPRHRFEPVALVFGAVFVAAGLIVLAGGELTEEGRALVPAGLIALGVALLVHVGRRAVRPRPDPWPRPARSTTGTSTTSSPPSTARSPTGIERTPQRDCGRQCSRATPDTGATQTDLTQVDATQADLTQVDVTQVDATEVEATEPDVTEADTTPADPEPDVTEVVDPTERYPRREPE